MWPLEQEGLVSLAIVRGPSQQGQEPLRGSWLERRVWLSHLLYHSGIKTQAFQTGWESDIERGKGGLHWWSELLPR